MTLPKRLLVSIVCLLFLSAAFAENLIWDPATSPDVKGYIVKWGAVGGATNTVAAKTNLVTWTNPNGGTFVKPGVSNLTLTLGTRYFFYVVSTNATVISDPSTILFYTPLDAPANPLIIGQ